MNNKICNSILDCIGNTPMVRVSNIAKKDGIECEILAKCEFMNPGGSVKDRIGKNMIDDAEQSGKIKPGATLVEPTSGNTGIGLALTAAVKGYNMVITLPEKMSQEKVDVMDGLGAKIIRTPTEAGWDDPRGNIEVAHKMAHDVPNCFCLNQHQNPANPDIHFRTTGQEIYDQCDGKIDVIVVSAGTGGTITGISKKIKKLMGNKCLIVGVDPEGSILAQPDSLNGPEKSYTLEGIGYDFVPGVLDRSLVDKWVKINDKESYIMARRLIKEEGMLVGGSSGAAMVAAMKVIKELKLGKGKRIVCILPDGVRNYMSKFLSDKWMKKNGFLTEQECSE